MSTLTWLCDALYADFGRKRRLPGIEAFIAGKLAKTLGSAKSPEFLTGLTSACEEYCAAVVAVPSYDAHKIQVVTKTSLR